MLKRDRRAFFIGVIVAGIVHALTIPLIYCVLMERYGGFCETVQRLSVPGWIEWIFVIPTSIILIADGSMLSLVARFLGHIPAMFGWIWYISLTWSVLLSLACCGGIAVILSHLPSLIKKYGGASPDLEK